MVYLAIAELVVIVALLVRHDQALAHRDGEWAKERSELLARAMHPQAVFPPARMQGQPEPSEQVPDEFELVGRIIDFPDGDSA